MLLFEGICQQKSVVERCNEHPSYWVLFFIKAMSIIEWEFSQNSVEYNFLLPVLMKLGNKHLYGFIIFKYFVQLASGLQLY